MQRHTAGHAARPFILLAVVAMLAACDDPSRPVAPAASTFAAQGIARTVTTPADGPWQRIVEGSAGPGSQFALYIPRDWNGDAVSYAHGFRDAASPVDLRDQDQLFAIRDELGARGYAVAYSSYSSNGFVVKDGGQRTHQLRGLLAAELGAPPARHFLAGHSLGGGIALDLVERYPTQYDGALLLCGMVGGSRLQTQYLGHARALADVFFPGRFPGNAVGVPDGSVIALGDVAAAVAANPAGLLAIGSSEQVPLPFVPVGSVTNPATPAFQTLVGSLFAALSFHARGINDVTALLHGRTPFENAATTYALRADPLVPGLGGLFALANVTVARFEMTAPAEGYLERYFEPTGQLRVPVLTVHNLWDPAVPMFHEAALRERVAGAGAGAQLLQRTIPTYGHCAITAPQAVQAFADLTQWVGSGVKPAN